MMADEIERLVRQRQTLHVAFVRRLMLRKRCKTFVCLCNSTVFYGDCKTFHQNTHALMEYAISIEIYCASAFSWKADGGKRGRGRGGELRWEYQLHIYLLLAWKFVAHHFGLNKISMARLPRCEKFTLNIKVYGLNTNRP